MIGQFLNKGNTKALKCLDVSTSRSCCGSGSGKNFVCPRSLSVDFHLLSLRYTFFVSMELHFYFRYTYVCGFKRLAPRLYDLVLFDYMNIYGFVIKQRILRLVAGDVMIKRREKYYLICVVIIYVNYENIYASCTCQAHVCIRVLLSIFIRESVPTNAYLILSAENFIKTNLII